MKTNVQRRTGILPVIISSIVSSCSRDASRGLGPSRVKLGGRLEACPTLGALVLALSLLALAGCGRDGGAEQRSPHATKPVVISANYPLHYFAQRIGGEVIDTLFLVPISTDGSSTDPAYWVPTSEAIDRMQQADLILLNGAGYEKWLPTVTLAESKVVDTLKGFRDQFITEEAGPSHQHGPTGRHSHGEIAFTTWLDLSLAIQQAQAVERAFVRLLPNEAEQLARNLASLTNDLAALDTEFLAWGQSMSGGPLIASHPVYQYFARRYGLNLRSVHWEPDEVPDEAAWRELEAMLQDHPAKEMIWEGEPRDEVVARLKTLGVGSVVVSPCGNPNPPVGFLEAMQKNAVRLKSMEGVDLATP